MKIFFIGIIIIIILGVLFIVFYHKKINFSNIQFTDVISLFVTVILVFITGFYAYSTEKMAHESRELAEETKIANRINYRPYVLIKPPIVSSIINKATKSERERVMSDVPKGNEEGYGFIKDPNSDIEEFYFALENVGSVPAHIMRLEFSINEINKQSGEIKNIKKEIYNKENILFPNKDSLNFFRLGKNIAFRETKQPLYLQISIKVIYMGSYINNENIKYYSHVVIETPIIHSPLLKREVLIIKEDEGIIINN